MTMTDRQKKFPEEEVIAAVSANPPVAAPAPAPVPAPVTNYTGGYTASYAPTVTLPGGMQYTDYNANLRPSLKNERRALLASMAEFGTGGLAAYQQARNQTEQSRAASIEKAAARGAAVHAPRALGTELISEYDTLMSGLTDAQSSGMISHGREMDRIAAANAAYLDQIGAAGGLAAADFERLAARQDMLASQARAGGGGGGGDGGGFTPKDPQVDTDIPEDSPERVYMTFDELVKNLSAQGVVASDNNLQQAVYQLYNSGVIDSQALYDLGRAIRSRSKRAASTQSSPSDPTPAPTPVPIPRRSITDQAAIYAAAQERLRQSLEQERMAEEVYLQQTGIRRPPATVTPTSGPR